MSKGFRHVSERLHHVSEGFGDMWKGVPDIAKPLAGQENLRNDSQSWKLRNRESVSKPAKQAQFITFLL